MRNAFSSIASTILSGTSNVVIQLLAAGMLSVTEYARFTIAAATILLTLGFARTLVGQIDLIRGDRSRDQSAIGFAYTFALACILIGCLTAGVAWLIRSDSLIAIGLSIGLAAFFVVQDSTRFRAFRTSQPHWALASDALVLVLTIGIFFLWKNQLSASLALLLVWSAVSGAGVLVTMRPLQYWASLRNSEHWWARNKDLMVPAVLEYIMGALVPYLLYWAVLFLGGAPALAGYRIVQLVFAGLGSLAQGLTAFELPRLPDPITRQSVLSLHVRNAVMLVAPAILLWVFLRLSPDELGTLIFGDAWFGSMVFLTAGAVHGTVNALGIPNFLVLQLLGEARFSLVVRTVSVILTPIVCLLFGQLFGVIGIAWGLALVTSLGYAARLIKMFRVTAHML